MANLLIKPTTGPGNKLILQDQEGGDAIEIADTGTTLTAPTLAGNATASGNLTVSGDLIPSSALSHRNLIINGAMQVAQRGTSFADVGTTAGYYSFDRWRYSAGYGVPTSRWTVSSQAPGAGALADGFTTSQKWSCTTLETQATFNASTNGGIRYVAVGQPIEYKDLLHLRWGDSTNVKKTVISFWVKSSRSGDHGFTIHPNNGAGALPLNYNVTSANVWQKIEIPITSTTLPTLNTDFGAQIMFLLCIGNTLYGGTDNVYVADGSKYSSASGQPANIGETTSDYLEFTGVQWELGSNATPFEHRSYGDELAKCQRYCYRIPTTGTAGIYDQVCAGFRNNTNSFWAPLSLPCEMRGVPVITSANLAIWYGTLGSWSTTNSGLGFYGTEFPSNIAPFSLNGISTSLDYGILSFQSGGYIQLDAEL